MLIYWDLSQGVMLWYRCVNDGALPGRCQIHFFRKTKEKVIAQHAKVIAIFFNSWIFPKVLFKQKGNGQSHLKCIEISVQNGKLTNHSYRTVKVAVGKQRRKPQIQIIIILFLINPCVQLMPTFPALRQNALARRMPVNPVWRVPLHLKHKNIAWTWK